MHLEGFFCQSRVYLKQIVLFQPKTIQTFAWLTKNYRQHAGFQFIKRTSVSTSTKVSKYVELY